MRFHHSILVAVAACAAVLVALAGPTSRARADLEVTVPPGSPLDWSKELPDRIPRTRAVTVEKGKADPKPEEKKGGTGVREKENISTEAVEAKPELGSATYLPKLFSGVLTDDLPFHVPWVKRQGELVMRQYPPTVTDDLYWMAQAAYLRRLLHPTLVPESETYWYLLLLGDSAREVSVGAKAERFLAGLAQAVEAAIEKAPAGPPDVPPAENGDTAELKMLVRLAVDDLMAGDPHLLDPTYAARLLSLGDMGIPALLRCAGSPHVILRRNAISLLGNYAHPDAVTAVRKAFRDDADACVRMRALASLMAKKDADVVPDLVKMLEGSDLRLRPLAAHALGKIGAKEAVPALVAAIDGAGEDWDLLVAAAPALARAAAVNAAAKEAVPVLKKLEASLRGPKARFVEPPSSFPQQPDVPDAAEVKNRMLLELATAALARLSDKEGQTKLVQLVLGKFEDPKNPVGHANASGPERQYVCDALKWMCPSSQHLVVEAWSVMGPEGAARLKQSLEHTRTNETLRMLALKQEPIAKNKQLLAEMALNSDSASVRGLAVRALFNVDDKAGVKLAESILATYIAGKPMHKTSPKGDVSVVTALEVLYKAKKLKSANLKQAVNRAISEWEYQRPEVSAEGMKPFKFSPPILETITWMLGATQDKDAVAVLKKLCADRKLPARVEATIAIGKIPGDPSLQALGDLLEDDDGWVRYNAFLGLRMLTGEDVFADWVYGSKSDREDAVRQYRDVIKKKK